MTYSLTDRTIAMAGIYQATTLVQQVAKTGRLDEKAFEASIKSIFFIDVDKPIDVFEGAENIRIGLKTLVSQLGGDSGDIEIQKDMHVTKYAIGAVVLERKLNKNQDMLNKISSGIELAKNQAEHFSTTHENVIANLADLYSKTISTLQPRIMVEGENIYITNPGHTNKIRALLLAAIRAVVLWRQCGGTRWQLILHRKSIIDNASALLEGKNN